MENFQNFSITNDTAVVFGRYPYQIRKYTFFYMTFLVPSCIVAGDEEL